jgi:hypothetical protein
MDWSFLKDPAVWSALIAVLALILSQLPPLPQLLAGEKVQATLRDRLGLFHFLGNLSIQYFVDIENMGSTSVPVRAIACFIVDQQNNTLTLPVQNYFSRAASVSGYQDVPFSPISLKPGEHWAELVRCYNDWSEGQEREQNNIVSSIQKNIFQKQHQRFTVPAPGIGRSPPNWPTQAPIEADDSLVKDAIAFFKKNFKLDIGNYHLLVAIKKDETAILSVKGVSFTIYESQIQALRSHVDDYKVGVGIYVPISDPQKSVFVRLRPIEESDAAKLYQRAEARMRA